MATALTPTTLSRTAATALGTPPAADVTGNTFSNGGDTFLYLECGATPRTVEVAFARGVDGVLPDPRSISLAANFKGFLRIGSVADYGSTVTVTASHAEVLIKVFQL